MLSRFHWAAVKNSQEREKNIISFISFSPNCPVELEENSRGESDSSNRPTFYVFRFKKGGDGRA